MSSETFWAVKRRQRRGEPVIEEKPKRGKAKAVEPEPIAEPDEEPAEESVEDEPAEDIEE
jgi:hypothetical protein